MTAFSLSFAGIQVTISPSASSGNEQFCIAGVRHRDDGCIEAELRDFSGTIIISEESPATRAGAGEEAVVDATPERPSDCPPDAVPDAGGVTNIVTVARGSPRLTADSTDPKEHPEPFVPPLPRHQSSKLAAEVDSGDNDAKKIKLPPESSSERIRFDLFNAQDIQSPKPEADLTLHKACASEDAEIDELRELLRSKPELAAVEDEFGDYAAHIFANNDSFIYTPCEEDAQQFVFELYTAFPDAFLTQGYDGQTPFAGTIADWVDDCHQFYARGTEGVHRVSEIKTLTKSARIINSLCVREDVQRLVNLPSHVRLTPKVFKMLSFILDALSRSALEDISIRREFWAVAYKRRDKIIGSVASIPFIVRTILLIENKIEREELIGSFIVRNLIFRPEAVDLWLVGLLSGGEQARACASDYLHLISVSSLSGLFGRRMNWSESDYSRFVSMREKLYDEVGKLTGLLPCMLHLGDSLYEVSTKRVVKSVVESTIAKPLPVYIMFMETFLLLILMTTYRVVLELVYLLPYEDFLSQCRDLWGLALLIAVYFFLRDSAIMLSFMFTEEKLVRRYISDYGNMVSYGTTTSAIVVLSMLHVDGNIEGRKFVGIVPGLLWWKFLLHVKGMSENLSLLLYTIMQIAAKLKYFLLVFLVAIFFFADMIDIVKKTSGECDNIDSEDSGLETFCSLTPLQTYLAMYGVMIGGMELSSLDGASALVSLLFVAASFSGVIVLVNILIAMVTGEYAKAQERSFTLFTRARLEAAARQDAREKMFSPPDDPTSGLGRKIWRINEKIFLTAFVALLEYYLLKSLFSASSLHKEGIIGDFLWVAMVLCAILHHTFLVAAAMYLVAKAIKEYEVLRCLRGSKFHHTLLKICLSPVCSYLKNIGLGRREACRDALDIDEDHPLSYNDFSRKQADFEESIQQALRASETRTLLAVRSMLMSSQVPLE